MSDGESASRACPSDSRCRPRILRSVILAVVLSIPLVASAQSIHLRSYTGADGLIGAPVWSLIQDRRGYLWIGTSSGAMRYDGVRFDRFGSGFEVVTRDTQQILEKGDGDLWLRVGDGLVYDGTTVKPLEGIEAARWPTAFDALGNFWYIESGDVLAVFDGEQVHRHDLSIEPEPINYSVVPLGDSIWLGTRESGVIEVRAEGTNVVGVRRFDTQDGLAGPMVRAIVRDESGRMYFGTRGGGISRLDGAGFRTFDTRHGLSGNDIYSLLINRQGEIVVGTFDNGVSICSLPDFDSCRRIAVEEGLYGRSVTALFEDREGTLWIGLSNGLTKVLNEGLHRYLDLGGVPADTVTSIFVDVDHSIWVGTFYGLARLDPDREWSRVGEREGLVSDEIRAIYRDRSGTLWIGTVAGLCSQRPGGAMDCTHRIIFPYVFDLVEDGQGRLWVATPAGVSRIDPGGATVNIETPSVSQIAVDSRDRLWVGTDVEGIFVIEDDVPVPLGTSKGLPSTQIIDLHADRAGGMWVGTHGAGLLYLRDEDSSFEPIGAEEFGKGSVGWILEDGGGTMWMGTSEGVFALDASTRELRRPFKAREWIAGSSLIWQANARAIDEKGDLWFALDRGLGRFETRAWTPNSVVPTAAIELVKVGDDTIYRSLPPVVSPERPTSTGPSIPHGRTTLRFEFRGLSFRDERDVRFRYRLAGYDDRWSESIAETFKDFTNLDPGHYRFEVIAANADGVWSAAPASFSFEILPPFWQTAWFRAVVILSLGILILAVYEIRTRSIRLHNLELQGLVEARTGALVTKARELELANEEIRRVDALKDRFLASVSHELRTPLNAIIGFSEILLTRADGIDAGRVRKFHHNIHAAGLHLLNLINNLLDMSKIQAGKMDLTLEDLSVAEAIEEVSPMVRGIAEVRNIAIRIDAPSDLPMARLDKAKVRQTMLNLMSNAIKFSREGSRVELAVRRVSGEQSPLSVDSLEIAVTDEGIGIEKEELSRIFEEFEQAAASRMGGAGTGLGLAIVKQFTEMQGGIVNVWSSPGEGSVFRVILPVSPEFVESGAAGGEP